MAVTSHLPTNLDDLLRKREVESQRVKLKVSLNLHTTAPQTPKTVRALANDCPILTMAALSSALPSEKTRSPSSNWPVQAHLTTHKSGFEATASASILLVILCFRPRRFQAG